MWRADRIDELLSTKDADVLFLSGVRAIGGSSFMKGSRVVVVFPRLAPARSSRPRLDDRKRL